METLEEVLREVSGQDLGVLMEDCERNGGICSLGVGSGLATLAFGLRM